MQEATHLIIHDSNQYLCQAFFQRPTLKIEVFSKVQNKKYHRVIHQNSLSQNIRINLKNLQVIWSCLKEKEFVQVDLEKRVVIINSFLGVEKKLETIQTQIQLFQSVSLANEQLFREFYLLQNRVSFLQQKTNKFSTFEPTLNKFSSFDEKVEQKVKQIFKEFQRNSILCQIQISKQQQQVIQREKQLNQYQLKIQNIENHLERLEKSKNQCEQKIQKIQLDLFINKNYQKDLIFYTLQKNERTFHEKIRNIQDLQLKAKEKHRQQIKTLEKHLQECQQKINYCSQHNYEKNQCSLSKFNKNEEKQKISFNLETNHKNCFKIKDTVIRYIGENKKWTIFEGKNIIKKNSVSEHKFRILKTKFANISIGVVDKLQLEGQRQGRGKLFSISYGMDNGILHDQGQQICKGGSVKEKDQVILRIDAKKGVLEYIFERNNFSHECKAWLLDRNKQIVPYLELYRTGDEVEWLS